jgi:hypothetical protein
MMKQEYLIEFHLHRHHNNEMGYAQIQGASEVDAVKKFLATYTFIEKDDIRAVYKLCTKWREAI